MTVTDRARDIAVLMSMGARREQIRGIFFLQGLAIGGVGTLVGLTCGYAVAWIAGTYRLIPLDPEIYSIPYVPFNPTVLDALWIAVAAVAICAAATLVPARAASRFCQSRFCATNNGAIEPVGLAGPECTLFGVLRIALTTNGKELSRVRALADVLQFACLSMACSRLGVRVGIGIWGVWPRVSAETGNQLAHQAARGFAAGFA